MTDHEKYVNYIQQSVQLACPYEDDNLRRLYHAGFLASYLASMFERDPWYFREFQRHIRDTKNSK